MLSWITDYIKYVEKRPQDFNNDIKNNIRQIKELLSRPNIEYKKADPIACDNLAQLFKHREGIWAGQPIKLNMEQRYMVACVLGIKQFSKEYNKYIRYFNEFNLFVSRKWGKDTFIVPLISYFIGFDKEPNAWCQIVAENEKQSKRTYDIIKNEIKQYPLDKIFIERKTNKFIECKINSGKIEYLSGRVKGKDGSNPSCGVANEIHEITNFNQYNAIKSGMGARSQPIMIVISSAGITPESLFESLQERNRKFLSKKKLTKNDRIFAMMYGIDDTDDYLNESCWIKANPAMYEGRPTLKFLREQYESMKSDPIMLNTFLSKHLNRQVGASLDFYDILEIKKAMRKVLKEDFVGKCACAGVDLSETMDLTNATVKIVLPKGKSIILQAYFIAEDCLERNSKKDNQDYKIFSEMKTENEITSRLVFITPGNTVKYEYITAWFKLLRDEYNLYFWKIGYDKTMSNYWLSDMVNNGFSHEKVEFDKDKRVETRDYGILTPCYQGVGLNEAIRFAKVNFELGNYIIDENNKLLPYCFWNLRVRSDNDNRLSVSKAKSTGHIDGCIGLFNSEVAFSRARQLEDYSDYLENL